MIRKGSIRAALLVTVALALVLLGISSVLADETGWKDPSANMTCSGDGFANPENAYNDGAGAASDGDADSHIYYNYDLGIPPCAIIDGIEVRLDWWVAGVADWNNMTVDLSWDGGANWTPAQADSTTQTTEHTGYVGGPGDTWGRPWTPGELSNANFRVRVEGSSST